MPFIHLNRENEVQAETDLTLLDTDFLVLYSAAGRVADGTVANAAVLARDNPPQALAIRDAVRRSYRGNWAPGNYKQGEWVIRFDRLWVALTDTNTVPQHDNDDWMMAGADAIQVNVGGEVGIGGALTPEPP